MEQLAQYFKKYGLAGVLSVVVVTGIPQVEKYVSSQTSKTTEAFMYKLKGELLADIQRMLDMQTRIAVDAHAKTKLTDKQAIYIMKTAVGYQSIHKVEWLKRYLGKLDPEVVMSMQNSVRSAIQGELIRQSSTYIEALNNFVHPKLGRLGDYVENHFDMKGFLDGIYEIVLNSDCYDCDLLYDIVMYHMLNSQNELWDRAVGDLSR